MGVSSQNANPKQSADGGFTVRRRLFVVEDIPAGAGIG
jgi:hypothetical protein